MANGNSFILKDHFHPCLHQYEYFQRLDDNSKLKTYFIVI